MPDTRTHGSHSAVDDDDGSSVGSLSVVTSGRSIGCGARTINATGDDLTQYRKADTNPTGEVEVTQAERDAGYAEAEEMLRALLSPDLISGTAIRVARDYMMQFARHHRTTSTPPVPDVAAIPVGMKPWAEGVGACVLAFADGAMTLNRDGSGELSFDEDDLEWVPADDSTKDYRVCKLPASEVEAIRDHLNKHFPPPVAPVATGQRIARTALNQGDR